MTTYNDINKAYNQAASEYYTVQSYFIKLGIKPKGLMAEVATKWEIDAILLGEYICGLSDMKEITLRHIEQYGYAAIA